MFKFAVSLITIGALVSGVVTLVSFGKQAEKDELAHPTCRTDYRLCGGNDHIVLSHLSGRGLSIAAECKSSAENNASYGKPEFSWPAFPVYFLGDTFGKTGKAVLLDNDAAFNNQFGAKVNAIAVCTYDLAGDYATVQFQTK